MRLQEMAVLLTLWRQSILKATTSFLLAALQSTDHGRQRHRGGPQLPQKSWLTLRRIGSFLNFDHVPLPVLPYTVTRVRVPVQGLSRLAGACSYGLRHVTRRHFCLVPRLAPPQTWAQFLAPRFASRPGLQFPDPARDSQAPSAPAILLVGICWYHFAGPGPAYPSVGSACAPCLETSSIPAAHTGRSYRSPSFSSRNTTNHVMLQHVTVLNVP
ncbi:ADL070Cp [Eremothecium gossypii ATCC 10895]|uniref:ADL070Cp n=1 Tax=Eremothecium gossypii (strain ATCC 10895 / CBS 109.51 / FGSC 9923 / NRRL Y-1056) TaxID=284811 RepID=Q75AJ7_EREGS|nr:ADL070Cp [Eremothecium gossypii ATCC 10895]AAS51850.1 ADL070Cp [Eremothecium gossypii ATCC 10895]AEY96147.1 FADL070Cp [Eremothecium gossypii FDAG1]